MHILEVTQNVHSGEALIQVVQSVILLEQTLTETTKTLLKLWLEEKWEEQRIR